MAKGHITIGRNTAGHGATLRKLGYEVTDAEPVTRRRKGQDVTMARIAVEGAGEFRSELDLSNGPEGIAEVVANQDLLTYGTRIKVPGKDEPVHGILACTQLETLVPGSSCLVVADPETVAKKAAAKGAKPGADAENGIFSLIG